MYRNIMKKGYEKLSKNKAGDVRAGNKGQEALEWSQHSLAL